jgi:hypothetical protein
MSAPDYRFQPLDDRIRRIAREEVARAGLNAVDRCQSGVGGVVVTQPATQFRPAQFFGSDVTAGRSAGGRSDAM